MTTSPSKAKHVPQSSRPVQRTIASAWMRGVADQLRAQGLDVPVLFRDAGLDMRALEHADGR